MPQNDILNNNGTNFDDFELPPLPKRPAKNIDGTDADSAKTVKPVVSVGVADNELPPLPEKTVDNSLDAITDIPDNNELPPLPEKTVDNSLDAISNIPETSLPDADEKKHEVDKVEEIDLSGDDFELPPMPERPKPETENEEEIQIYDTKAEEAAEKAKADEEKFVFEDDYDADLDHISTDSIILEDLTDHVAPIRTREEESARNIKEKIKMDDLEMEMGPAPILEDLSDEYAAPQKKAESLVDRDQLDSDEKRVLKQRLEEDLSKRPENFNARASKNMYNRLMEEKKLKIAKKGFGISLIPIAMGLGSAVISAIFLNWGSYLFFQYVAVFMIVGALMLFIKSKHVKMLSIAMYAVSLLLYVGVGLGLYVVKGNNDIIHLVTSVLASGLNIVSIVILTKSEAVNTYYSSDFKKK